jgi:hypothetical protein
VALPVPERHRDNTLAAPECRRSCKQVAGKLQACCRLVGSFLVLLFAPDSGQALVPSRRQSAWHPARPAYRYRLRKSRQGYRDSADLLGRLKPRLA